MLEITFLKNIYFLNVIKDAAVPVNYTIERAIAQQYYNTSKVEISNLLFFL